MPKTDSKHIKIEIESASGTLVDLTKYVNTVTGPVNFEITDAETFCVRCFSRYPKYKFMKRFRTYLFKKFHKCNNTKDNIQMTVRIPEKQHDIPTNRNQRR